MARVKTGTTTVGETTTYATEVATGGRTLIGSTWWTGSLTKSGKKIAITSGLDKAADWAAMDENEMNNVDMAQCR